MAGGLKSAGAAWMAVTALLLLAPAAHAEMGRKANRGAPTTQQKPRVDEKAYKAALDRIPDPKKPYDPWGQVHDSQSGTKSPGKSN